MRDTPPRGPVVTMSDPPNLDGALWAGALSRAMALLAGGHVDLGFIGGAQIDRHANLNTTRIGPADAPRVRLPGSGGGCDIACAARRLLVVMPHEPRRFVERVDHRTSPGYGDGPGWRERVGLPACESVTLITTRAVLRATEATAGFELVSRGPAGARPRAGLDRRRLTADRRPHPPPGPPPPPAAAGASYRLAMSTAIRPDRKMPSKVPAPPMEATGAPSARMRGRFSRSAPTRVPSTPPT